ncbi:GNAT family N-acetyltransferase [Mesorhizobium sp. M00.F.Ca.ET.216.01.1.1]|uniref:GNAT family N-acetyltransferase n=1 Tax=Mesorhizobium sp. M00.F.Ca.ET.216.01.1.1 TaxID=2500528 RepID=UPI000FDA3D97|nr:GNAT family N-acetyltransferase [Mesorhizobium sp. M00.F.Ca.ET.216.01.1.1]TGQ42063.1 GNAT family N-acetyltransferase [Mesorhizobium sp. M00.F.Ca.ET.216.01.1.1]TJW14905.1 MAG: GNAT family N-acetyltransferase [Mesorhizobium sp.]TJW43961.1 MAG: GNAT family N-acetyltransferase [Mesorhizobium sp.]
MNTNASIDVSGAERLEIVRSADRLAAVEADWMHLWRRTDGLIFQSHAWISAWWSTVSDRDQRALRIGLIWNGDRLVAVFPLAISKRRGLRFLEWAASSYTDYGDILVALECSLSALQDLWAQLCDAGGFDIAFLNRLLPDAAAHKIFAPGASGGVKLRPNHREEVSYRVAGQWESGAAWLEDQSKKARQNYRRGMKTLEEAGEMKFRLLAPDEPLQPVLDRLSVLKRRWLELHTRESQLFEEGAPVLAALVDALARAGVLRIFVIECDGAMIAVSINFIQHGVMMAFVTTYDPDFSRASPGVILMMDYIQWSIDHGLGMIDFLCGAESFKHKFATQAVTLQSVLGARTALGTLASLADRIRQRIRHVRERGLVSSS